MPVRFNVRHVGESEYKPVPVGHGLRFGKWYIVGFNFRKKVRYVNTNFISRFGHVHSDRFVLRHSRRDTSRNGGSCSINRKSFEEMTVVFYVVTYVQRVTVFINQYGWML